MSEASHLKEYKIETYARTLLEAAKTEGREHADLRLMEHLRNMTPEVAQLLSVVLENHDEDLFPQIAKKYREVFNDQEDVIAVQVTTAIELDNEMHKQVTNELEKVYNKKVYIIEHVDPSIVGGIIYSARGVRVDASVKTQLEQAKHDLKQMNEGE